MGRLIRALANAFERGVWGQHFLRYYAVVGAPWAKIIVDSYTMRQIRKYRVGSWMIVVFRLSRS